MLLMSSLFFLYQEIHPGFPTSMNGLSLRLTSQVALSAAAPYMLETMITVEATAVQISHDLDLIISQSDELRSTLTVEIIARGGGYLPWKWWRAQKGKDHHLVNSRNKVAGALFKLKTARLGLHSLQTAMRSLIKDASLAQASLSFLPETSIIRRHILGIVGIRVSKYLRTEGEVDTVAVVGERVLETAAVGNFDEID